MDASLTFTTQIELEDYLVFNSLLIKRRLPLMVGFLFFITLVASWQVGGEDRLMVFFLVFVILIVIYFMVMKTFGRWQAKNLFNSHLEISEPRTYSFDEKGGSIESVSTSGTFLWGVVAKVEELDAILLIYRGQNTAHIIRKLDLNENQLQEFRNLVTTVPGLDFKRVDF